MAIIIITAVVISQLLLYRGCLHCTSSICPIPL